MDANELLNLSESEYLRAKLQTVLDDLGDARGREANTAITQLHRLELEVVALYRASVAAAGADAPASETPRQRLLRQTVNLRLRCEAAGSMTAAAKLLEREQSILSEIDAERIETAERERLASDEGAFMGRFLAAYDAMPPALRRRLLQQLTERAA